MDTRFGYTPEQYKKFKKYGWLMLLSFGLTYLFFYNGRQNINLVLSEMEKEFGSGAAAMGLVTSALFWCYAFGQLISGRLGAYLGYKKFMIFGIVSSAAINVIISFQTNITVIAILWGLNGFCQSTVWANGLGVLNKWWPKKQRGFASGLATACDAAGFETTVRCVTVFSGCVCCFGGRNSPVCAVFCGASAARRKSVTVAPFRIFSYIAKISCANTPSTSSLETSSSTFLALSMSCSMRS